MLDTVSGLHHILVHGIQKITPDTSPDHVSLSDDFSTTVTSDTQTIDQKLIEQKIIEQNLNDLNRTYTKPPEILDMIEKDINANEEETQISPIEIPKKPLTNGNHNLVSKIPVSALRRKSKDMTSRKNSENSLANEISNNVEVAAVIEEVNATDEIIEPSNLLVVPNHDGDEIKLMPIEKSMSLNEFEKLEKTLAEAADSVEDIEEMEIENEAIGSETVLDSHAETIDLENNSNKSSAKSESSKKSLSLKGNSPVESKDHEIEKESNHTSTSTSRSKALFKEEAYFVQFNQMNNIENHTHLSEVLNGSRKNSNSTDMSDMSQENSITFINNGIDMTKVHEINDSMKISADNLEETLLGEKLSGINETATGIDVKEGTKFLSFQFTQFKINCFLFIETKRALKEMVNDVPEPIDERSKIKTPMPKKNGDSVDIDDDGERTTASITSIGSDKNSIELDDYEAEEVDGKKFTIDGKEDGRVKRFITGLKNKGKNMSCKRSDTVVEERKF